MIQVLVNVNVESFFQIQMRSNSIQYEIHCFISTIILGGVSKNIEVQFNSMSFHKKIGFEFVGCSQVERERVT